MQQSKHQIKVTYPEANKFKIACSCGTVIYQGNCLYFIKRFGLPGCKKEDLLDFFEDIIKVHRKYPHLPTDALTEILFEKMKHPPDLEEIVEEIVGGISLDRQKKS